MTPAMGVASPEPAWWLWIVITLIAAASQTARNAMQKGLTTTVGTVGATLVRFLFGLPFAAVSLLLVVQVTGLALPRISGEFLAWVALGGITQITATALMLAAMRLRSFVVATAYVKTEAIQVALFALLFLSETLSPMAVAAIVTATVGVFLMSWPRGLKRGGAMEEGGSWKPVAMGLLAGSFFAGSAVGFKGAIVTLGAAPAKKLPASRPIATGFQLPPGSTAPACFKPRGQDIRKTPVVAARMAATAMGLRVSDRNSNANNATWIASVFT